MKHLFLPLICLIMTTSCHLSEEKKTFSSGIDLTNLDTTTSPKVDFYQYACGGWMKKHPLTGEYARFGSFDKLSEENRSQVKVVIEEIASQVAEEGAVEQKIGDLYRLAMNEEKLEREGYDPIKETLAAIAAVQTREELPAFIAQLALSGVSSYFQLYVGADPMNSTHYLLQTRQGGLGMNNRDYYLEEGAMKEIREKYKAYVSQMFQLVGLSAKEADEKRDAVMKIETRLAKASYDKETLREPRTNYNKMSKEELIQLIPEIAWDSYFQGLGIVGVEEINVSQKPFMIEVGKIIHTHDLKDQIAYLEWKVINRAAPYLSDAFSNAQFDFYGKVISGKEEQQPRWKRAVNSVNNVLGEAVGQVYVKKYFPAEAKARMLTLVNNLQVALGERIETLEWMSEETKERAKEKLSTFYVKIGYPDKWRDYTDLSIKNDSYYANILRATQFEKNYMFSKIGKTVDKDEWHMTPQTVNAYYSPTTNEICFPAAILQYPFFSMDADDAFNYGAIGVVIGHEITHGFDDKGRQYDKSGNLNDWWSEEDGKRFDERVQLLEDFYSAIEVAPGVFGNGKFTLGENLADYGGLEISFQAFQQTTKAHPLPTIDGLTPEQRFFLAYSTVWANNIRPEEVLSRTKTDPHSLGKWRVNGALPQIEAWYKAFNIQEGDPMYVAPEKRVSIW